MHEYHPIYRKKNLKQSFSLFMQENLSQSPTIFNSFPKFFIFDILYDTLSKQIGKQNKYIFISDSKKIPGIPLFQTVSVSYIDNIFIYSPKDLTFDNLFDTISKRIKKLT